MKNSYIPYYTTPTCCLQIRPDEPATPQDQTQDMTQLQPITPTTQPQALTLQSVEFLNGYLRTQIGKRVRIEFLIGTGTLVDKFGTLLSVGANYLIIQQAETDDKVVCDFFTIKFVTFYL